MGSTHGLYIPVDFYPRHLHQYNGLQEGGG